MSWWGDPRVLLAQLAGVVFGEEELRQAAEERAALVQELSAALQDPQALFEGLAAGIAQSYQSDWREYQAHMNAGTLEGRFRAGLIFGALLVDILALLTGIAGVAKAGAKVAAKLPRLLKYARSVKLKPGIRRVPRSGEVRGGGGAPGGGGGAPEAPPELAQQPAPAKTQPAPKAAPQSHPPAKPPTPAASKQPLRAPAARHYATRVGQRTLAKDVNTVIEPGVDVVGDVAVINAGQASRVSGNWVVNGRTYGVHDGTLYPIEGPGFHKLTRGAFKALGVFNQFGNTPRAAEILSNMGTSAADKAAALHVFEVTRR